MKLEFFWDVGSPYTYLAMTQLPGLRQRTGAEVVYRPFLLGGVFRSVGNKMVDVAPKAKNLLDDLKRWRDWYRVEMKMPMVEAPFPLNTLLPMRAAVAADRLSAETGERFAHAIMRAYWAEGRDVSVAEEISRVAESIGLVGADLLAAAEDPVVKNTLRANTDEAVARGAYGAPAMFIGEELYWGNDRLQFVESKLRGDQSKRGV